MSASSTSTPPLLAWSSFISDEAIPFQTQATVKKALAALSATVQHGLDEATFPKVVDLLDPLAIFRTQFSIPKAKDIAEAILHGQPKETRGTIPASVAPEHESVYLCGNSLGLLPKSAQHYVQEELTKWSHLGVEGHFAGARPWARIDEEPTVLSLPVVGGEKESEIAIMNSLSVNLHLLLISFYRPSATRFKILMEADAFCSDHHIIQSQVELHGRAIDECIVTLAPRAGETILRTEDVIAAINQEGAQLAVVLLPGIQFYTGQFFDIPAITTAAHAVGAYAGWDLAHAVGNVPLKLHEWQVDFAAWCSYKYLNSGPGAIAGAFVHETHHASELLKLKGWWGQTPSQRFAMKSTHVEKPGAQSYMLSNPAVLPTVCMQASLEVHNKAGQAKMRAKSMLLTAYLEHLLKTVIGATNDESLAGGHLPSKTISVRILTPSLPTARGCQLSLLFSTPARPIHHALSLYGIVTDVREPNVIRVSPTPLYNTFSDVYQFVHHLKDVLKQFNEKSE